MKTVIKVAILKRMNSEYASRADSDSDLIFRRTLLGYYAEGMHANF